MSATEARNHFSETLNKVSFGKDRIVIHRNDKDVAALVPLEDVELLEMIEDKVDLMLVEEALRDDDLEEAVDLDTFLAEFDPE
jgi:prevent-host-death family protein